jgi:hypothetical protein
MIRDGLAWRISDDANPIFMYNRNTEDSHELMSYRNEAPLDRLIDEIDSAEPTAVEATTPDPAVAVIVSYTNIDAAYLSDMNTGDVIVSDMNTGTDILSDTKEVPAYIVSDMKEGDDFDYDKHFLGKLCRSKHDWRGTGQSLRKQDAIVSRQECLECQRLRSARRRQREAARA